MDILHTDAVFRVAPGTQPNYDSDNPVLRVLGLIERMQLAAEREFYVAEQLQYLIPYEYLELYGPSQPNQDQKNPREQDDKNDFQKQNVRDFRTTDTHVIRGLVTAGNWTGPFVRLSYRGGPDSKLSELARRQLGSSIKA